MKNIKLDKLPKNVTAPTVPTAKAAGGSTKSAGQWWKYLVSALMLAYIILPTDFMPDLIPIVGWLDDIVAAAGMVISTISAIKNRRYDPNARMEERAKDVFGDDNY